VSPISSGDSPLLAVIDTIVKSLLHEVIIYPRNDDFINGQALGTKLKKRREIERWENGVRMWTSLGKRKARVCSV